MLFLQKTAGRLGMRVLGERGAFQHLQTGHLVLAPAGLMHSRTTTGLAGVDAAPVPSDGDLGGGRRGGRFAAVMDIVLGALVACRLQFGADLLGKAVDVSSADGELGVEVEEVSGQLKGFDQACGFDDLVEDAWAIGMIAQVQQGTLREKNPADSGCKSKPARAVQRCRRGR